MPYPAPLQSQAWLERARRAATSLVTLSLLFTVQACSGSVRESSGMAGAAAGADGTAGGGGKGGGALAAAGSPGASAGGAGSPGAGAAGAGADSDVCSKYALRFSADCSDCPFTQLECTCAQGMTFPVAPTRCTTWGQCVEGVNCSQICKAFKPDGSIDSDVFLTTYTDLQSCENQRSCQSDAECPGGKCFHAQGAAQGQCSPATTDSPCLSAADCLSKICVTSVNGKRCEDGALEQPCDSDADCLSGSCPVHAVCPNASGGDITRLFTPLSNVTCLPAFKLCQDHSAGAFCDSAADCRSGVCVRYPADFGVCGDGSVATRCNQDADCASHSCVVPPADVAALAGHTPLGWCTTGAPGEPCATNANCTAGACHAEPEQDPTCTSGALQDPCGNDGECASGICVQLDGPNTVGICQNGLDPALCATDDDCLNHLCLGEGPAGAFGRSHHCTTGENGFGCWLDRDCLSGHCGPPPPGKEGAQGACVAQ